MSINKLDRPLLDASQEMSTALGNSDDVPQIEVVPEGRNEFRSSSDGNELSVVRSVKKTWNSWTGGARNSDNRQDPKKQISERSPRQPTHTKSNQRRSRPYMLYTHRETGGEEFDVIDLPSRGSSINSQPDSEVVIDGRFTSSFIESGDFETLGSENYGWDEPSTTRALDLCKKYILRPYNFLLKVIGWRKFRTKHDHDHCCLKVCNFIYPLFIILMLMFACAAQIVTCFSRSNSNAPRTVGNYSVLQCDQHLFTSDIIAYGLIISAYLGAFCILRWSESEHISSLSETVFLSYNYTNMHKSRKKPVFILLAFFVSGIIWFIFSFGVSILRMFALGLDEDSTYIEWFIKNESISNQPILKIPSERYSALHYFFVASSFLGFIFFDLLYIAVVINYSSQCQLITFYIENIRDKVQNKAYKSLNEACKEIYHVYEFLKVLNGKLAFVTTLIVFIFVGNVIASYRNLAKTDHDHTENIVLGFFNIAQWLIATAFPVLLATRLTAVGKGLCKLGLEISSRPFVYTETPDLELQMFLNFTDATRYNAKLAFVPMYPSLVMGFAFLVLLLLTLGTIPHVDSVSWF